MDNEEANELIVTDVPETSENLSEVETDASQEVNETQEKSVQDTQKSDDIQKSIEERANQLFEEKVEHRLIRDRVKKEEEFNSKHEKYEDLLNIVNHGFGTNNIDDAIRTASEFYKEQGIEIPARTKENNLTERQIKVLAEDEAKQIKDCGIEEMRYEADRINRIPQDKRSTRDKIVFKSLVEELVSQKNINDLKAKGYDTKILDSEDFKNFKSKFSIDVPVTEIFETYQKLNGTATKQEPKSPGSAKGVVSDNEIKELYTPDEVRKFTEEDLKNPKLMKAVEYSMTQWGKSSN